jgi:hypothetical protein
MDLEEQWQKFSLVKENLLVPQPHRFRVSFGVFLAVLVACGTLLGSVVVGALMYTATQDGNAVLAQDLQSVTSANMVQLLGVGRYPYRELGCPRVCVKTPSGSAWGICFTGKPRLAAYLVWTQLGCL